MRCPRTNHDVHQSYACFPFVAKHRISTLPCLALLTRSSDPDLWTTASPSSSHYVGMLRSVQVHLPSIWHHARVTAWPTHAKFFPLRVRRPCWTSVVLPLCRPYHMHHPCSLCHQCVCFRSFTNFSPIPQERSLLCKHMLSVQPSEFQADDPLGHLPTAFAFLWSECHSLVLPYSCWYDPLLVHQL